jgi:hypothetical protein
MTCAVTMGSAISHLRENGEPELGRALCRNYFRDVGRSLLARFSSTICL